MSKRIFTSAVLLVILLSIAPVATAAPPDRRVVDEDGLTGFVQAVWENLARFLGFGPEPQPVEPDRSEGPRSLSARDDIGPHIDP